MTIDARIAEIIMIAELIKISFRTDDEYEKVWDFFKKTTFEDLEVLKFLDCPDIDLVIEHKQDYEAGLSKESEVKLWERWAIEKQKKWN